MRKAVPAGRQGNLIITFALLISFLGMVTALFFMTSGNIRYSISKERESKAFYTAQAGLSKGIWYLLYNGGSAPYTTVESFDGGQYAIEIATLTSTTVRVTSVGTFSAITKSMQQDVSSVTMPAAFDYALFSNNNLNVTGSVKFYGDVYTNGNTSLGGSSSVISGEVYHPSGKTVSGSAVDGGTPSSLPAMPSLDTTSYTNDIIIASGKTSRSFNFSSDIYLSAYPDNTLYVNGSVSISGNTEIHGPGKIVSTGSIAMSGLLESESNISIISGSSIARSGTVDFENLTLYAATSISMSGSGSLDNTAIITPGNLSMSGTNSISGLIYAGNTAALSGTNTITGGLVASNISGFSGSNKIYYSASALALAVPPGFSASGYSVIKGTWKQF